MGLFDSIKEKAKVVAAVSINKASELAAVSMRKVEEAAKDALIGYVKNSFVNRPADQDGIQGGLGHPVINDYEALEYSDDSSQNQDKSTGSSNQDLEGYKAFDSFEECLQGIIDVVDYGETSVNIDDIFEYSVEYIPEIVHPDVNDHDDVYMLRLLTGEITEAQD